MLKTIHILLVEDNEGDILLTRVALENAAIDFKLSIASDGKEAIDFLSKANGFADREMPDLTLLDINLPKKNGHEVLAFMKKNESLNHIPVVMLTTSSSQNDIDMAYANNASGFITKPSDLSEFLNAVAGTVQYWIDKINHSA
ncbi:response regulator [Ferruginibacter paludis]|uniref:response regulator n=1 Tax=Ferruginibacter paludis TaxID=1310417 RepID=UPI0025B3029A|nr:response regulator [Ferruginibacter paludis]MDN3657002.1 response regulator [Ferruginibacter paludis]